jgi:chemotaxis protein methyltransferase CheR
MGEALREWEVVVLATDINPRVLDRARQGGYGEWSFRNTPPWVKSHYFRRLGDGRYEILPRIRRVVEFAYLNLVEDMYPSLPTNTNAMDLILCRNVLMYFDPALAKKVVGRFHRCLVPDGWLVVSPYEVSPALLSRFAARSFPDALLYQKRRPGDEDRRRSGEAGKRGAFFSRSPLLRFPKPSLNSSKPFMRTRSP